MDNIRFSKAKVAVRTRRRVIDELLANAGHDDLGDGKALWQLNNPAADLTTKWKKPEGNSLTSDNSLDGITVDDIPAYAVGDDLKRPDNELRARVLFLELVVRWRLSSGMSLEELAGWFARDLTDAVESIDTSLRKKRRPGRPKLYRLDELDAARLIAYTCLVARLDSSRKPGGAGHIDAQLATYCNDRSDRARYGLWLAEADYDPAKTRTPVERLIMRVAPWFNNRSSLSAVMGALGSICEVIELNQSPYLAAFENGVVDLRDKKLHGFSPDVVFTHKAHRYVADAEAPTMTTDRGAEWTLDGWLEELCACDDQSDEETAAKLQTLHEILAKTAFPNIPTSKAILLYDSKGGTGKGTFVKLLRGVAGPDAVFNRNFARLCTRFGWQGLGTRTVIAADENPVNAFQEAPENFKCAVTRDVLQIEGKGLPVTEQVFTGLLIFCMNGLPRVSDTSDSFLRRLLFRQFHKRYYDPLAGDDRSVVDRIVPSREVLDYATRLAVDAAHDWYERGTLGTWTECDEDRALLQSFAELNDPVRAFASSMSEWAIDGISTDVAYRAFRLWYAESFGEQRNAMGKQRFTEQLRGACTSAGWEDWTMRRWTSTNDDAVRLADTRTDELAGRYGLDKYRATVLACEAGRIIRGYRRASRKEPSAVPRVAAMCQDGHILGEGGINA